MNQETYIDETECIDIKIDNNLIARSQCFLNAYTLLVDEENEAKAFTPKNFPNEAVYILIIPQKGLNIRIFLKTKSGEWDSIVDGKGKLSPDQLAGFFKTDLFSKIVEKLKNSWPMSDAFYSTLFNCLIHKKICIDPPEEGCKTVQEDNIPVEETDNELKIVFIDFDGVIIPIVKNQPSEKYTFDQQNMSNLKTILDKTGAKVVFSTSWKKYDDDDTRVFGGGTYKNQIKDIELALRGYMFEQESRTPNLPAVHLKFKNGREGDYESFAKADEISAWLNNHPEVKLYVIFDDVDFMSGNLSERFGKNYIQTKAKEGIIVNDERNDVQDAINILNSTDSDKEEVKEDGEFDKSRINKDQSRGKNVAGKQIFSNSGRKLVSFSDFGVKHTEDEAYFCWPAIGKEFKWSLWADWEKIKPAARCRFQHNSYLYGFSLSPFEEDDKNRGFRGYNLTLEPKLQYITPIETEQAMNLTIMLKFLRTCYKRILKYVSMSDEDIYRLVNAPDRCSIEDIKKTKSVMKNTLKAIRDNRHDTYMYN